MTAIRQGHRAAPVPARPSVSNLRTALQECRACDLWEGATQAVMGEGSDLRGVATWLSGR
jgi:uracil-DNA glycosylase